jgi:nucleoside-diphosphate-sugar epimerase
MSTQPVVAIRRHFFWDASPTNDEPSEAWQPHDGNWKTLTQSHPPKRIVITWAPSSRSPEAYRACYVDGLKDLLDALEACEHTPECIVQISSASTIGGILGERINDESTCPPSRPQGHLLLESEHLCAEIGHRLNFRTTHLRLSGIYGPERLPGLRRLHAEKAIPDNPEGYLNLIHVDDAVSAAVCALDHAVTGPCIVSSESVVRGDFYQQIHFQRQTPAPIWSDAPNANLGRQLSSERFQNLTSWSPQWPSALEWMKREA